MKKIMILGMVAIPFFFASCGGGETEGEETTGADSTETEVMEETVITSSYNVDAEASVINWNNFDGEDPDHQGTVKALEGSIDATTTNGIVQINSASLIVDMNSISEGSEDLEGHLKNEDFFDVNVFATTEFTFDRHENDMIYGSVNIVGKTVEVEAPVTATADANSITIEVGDFKIDFSALEMPFFIADVLEPIEEQHNPMIGFSATIVGTSGQ